MPESAMYSHRPAQKENDDETSSDEEGTPATVIQWKYIRTRKNKKGEIWSYYTCNEDERCGAKLRLINGARTDIKTETTKHIDHGSTASKYYNVKQ